MKSICGKTRLATIKGRDGKMTEKKETRVSLSIYIRDSAHVTMILLLTCVKL